MQNLDSIVEESVNFSCVDSLNDWQYNKNCKDLCILHVNIRSITKHFSELLVTVSDHLKHIDILVVTEANINYSLLSFFKIEGFKVDVHTRKERGGGGVLVYSRLSLAASASEIAELSTASLMHSAECVSISFKFRNEKVYVVSIYRPPRFNRQDRISEFYTELRSLLHSVPANSKVVFCGDININLRNSQDNRVLTYENIMSEYGFIKCIKDVTRREIVTGKLVESCIDHIYVRAPLSVIDSAVIRHKISDHFFIAAAIEWKQRIVTNSGEASGRGRVRATLPEAGSALAASPSAGCGEYRATLPESGRGGRDRPLVATTPALPSNKLILDNSVVREKLLATNFDDILQIECPIELYNALALLFNNIYNACYKFQTVNDGIRHRNNKSWINGNLKKMILERDRLFMVWSNEPKNMLKRLNYTRYRNKCNKAVLKSKNEYDKLSIINCNKNIKKVWDKINNLLGKVKPSLDKSVLNTMEKQGSVRDICNKFAYNFSNEIEKIKHSCNDKWLNREEYVNRSNVCMRWQPVCSNDVKLVINKMNKNKAPGSDLVRMSDLKLVVDKVSPIIAKLINRSVSERIYPTKLKESLVRPIHKKGDRRDYCNYRPISILSSVDKVFEKCIVNQISSFLQKNNILYDSQHGFQKNKSTDTLLSRFTNEINTYLDNKKIVVAIFYDFKKAFDTLETDTLLNAMDECGVGQPLNPWFRDYLTSRSYQVKLGDALSDEVKVRRGVPQGSVCGPVCYLMHANSLCGVLRNSTAHMFADDLCTLRPGTDLAETCCLVQQDIDAVVKWSHDNGITLNSDKTKLLIIQSPYICNTQTHPSLFTHTYSCLHNNLTNCECQPIEKVNFVTYLGVKVDISFSWNEHISFLCSKLRVLLGKFYHLSYRTPQNILKQLYFALVDSVLSYALDSYGLTFKTYIAKLETLQIRFLKLLVNNKTKQSCDGNYYKLFKILKILPVHLKHKYLLAINNHSNLEHGLVLVNHSHSTRTVTSGKYEVPRVTNYYGDRTLSKRLPYLFNNLPDNIRMVHDKNKFKKLLKKYLLETLP